MFIETSLARTSWIRKENINVMCIRNRFPIRKFFSAIKSDRLNSLLYHNHSLDGLAFIHIFIGLINIFQFITCRKDSAWIDVAIKNRF